MADRSRTFVFPLPPPRPGLPPPAPRQNTLRPATMSPCERLRRTEWHTRMYTDDHRNILHGTFSLHSMHTGVHCMTWYLATAPNVVPGPPNYPKNSSVGVRLCSNTRGSFNNYHLPMWYEDVMIIHSSVLNECVKKNSMSVHPENYGRM